MEDKDIASCIFLAQNPRLQFCVLFYIKLIIYSMFFLQTTRQNGDKKGIKLDFKRLEAVEPSLLLLASFQAHQLFPVWLNADILALPGTTSHVVDPDRFLSLCQAYLPRWGIQLLFKGTRFTFYVFFQLSARGSLHRFNFMYSSVLV